MLQPVTATGFTISLGILNFGREVVVTPRQAKIHRLAGILNEVIFILAIQWDSHPASKFIDGYPLLPRPLNSLSNRWGFRFTEPVHHEDQAATLNYVK
jgi:hypothetical protein